jgi:hypothetical protein
MQKNSLNVSVAGFSFVLPALVSDRDDDIGRVNKATQVFQEIMRTPDKGIPRDLLEKAKCVAVNASKHQPSRRRISPDAATVAR